MKYEIADFCVVLKSRLQSLFSVTALLLFALSFSACTDYEDLFEEDYGYLAVDRIEIKDESSSSLVQQSYSSMQNFETNRSSSSMAVVTPVVSSSSAKSSSSAVQVRSFVDSRDGNTYKYVAIGNQNWMAENLKFVMDESVCYGGEAANCAKYGRLYTWADAKVACPAGWHLPSTVEWEDLFNAVGGQNSAGNVLKATSGWGSGTANGIDSYGFSILPGGIHTGTYVQGVAAFWSSDESRTFYADAYYFRENASATSSTYFESYALSVRCKQD